MAAKRTTQSSIAESESKKARALNNNSILYKTLEQSGLILKHPPNKCTVSSETIQIIRNIKKNLQKHFNYPRNVTDLYSEFVKDCENLDIFKHYLFPNIVRIADEGEDEHPVSDSVVKILLSIPFLQNKLIDYLFEKATDLAAVSKYGTWIIMILKCLSTLDSINDGERVSNNIINLLDIINEKVVRLEIITAIPDIVGDQEHNNIAVEMSRIMSEDHELIPATLDCLSYLCLSEEQYIDLQKKTLNILAGLSKCTYFANFIQFLLLPGRTNDSAYLDAVQGLRNAFGWPSSLATTQEIATSQVLTASAIRHSILSSKTIANSWLKIVSECKINTDHKSFDIIIFLIMYSISDEKQRQVENIIRKKVKMNMINKELLDEAFVKYKPILKEYLNNLIELTNSLLKTRIDPVIEAFASHLYMLMFTELGDCCQRIAAELLQVGLDCKQCMMNILIIFNNVASKDMSLLKSQSVQMLTLLDRTDDMTLNEIRAVMNLICGLAYSYENSVIRDDIHMIIRKELGCSNPKIKVQGILASIYAVKYLMATHDEENTLEFPDDISYGSTTFLSEGNLREAAQIIELMSRSTRQFPDMIAFFYDELSKIICTDSHINKNFMSWLTEAVTNDLQQNFITDAIVQERVCNIPLSMQYCLNEDSEMDEVIAINIAGLAVENRNDINVSILSPLFQLVQTLHFKQHEGDLSSIDALLGCPIIMPKFNIDLIEEFNNSSISYILDCNIYCINWFRELLNAFSMQTDEVLQSKILQRINQVQELENLIVQILVSTKITYKPPVSIFDVNKYYSDFPERTGKPPNSKQKLQKKTNQDDTLIPETLKTQITQNNSTKNSMDVICNIPFRHLNFNLIHLLKIDLTNEEQTMLQMNIKQIQFILKYVNSNLESHLLSQIKRKTFLSKPQDYNVYDHVKAEKIAKIAAKTLPYIMKHWQMITQYIELHNNQHSQNDSGIIYTLEFIDRINSLELIYNFCAIFFKWIGFRNQHDALFKSSLKVIVSLEKSTPLVSQKELVMATVKTLQKQVKFCLLFSTAISLIEFTKAVQDYTDSKPVLEILKQMAQNFLSQLWKNVEGQIEKGLIFNKRVDKLANIHFMNSDILVIKNLASQLAVDINGLKSPSDTLDMLKCFNKGNFTILFRNLGSALYDSAKHKLSKGLTNSEHLELWKDVAIVLKHMTEMTKTLENRNSLSTIFKKSLPVLKLFVGQGIPILELQFKKCTQEILEILKILQQTTRFLQSLCCHSRIKKDNVLLSKVPFMRQLLETLIYKVKAVLAANNCSEAFWMGNLKNKNIHGEVIATQQSVDKESEEDCDEQLPEDEDSDATDDELNPESKSISDIV